MKTIYKELYGTVKKYNGFFLNEYAPK